jgi:hypothetical protein
MNDTLNDMPMCECPHCGKGWQQDDYYDVKTDDEFECPHCEKTAYVVFVDNTINVRLSTEKED